MIRKIKITGIITLLVLFVNSCSSYYGKKDSSGRLRVKEKHWTLKNIPNQGIKRILDTKVWYRSQYSFRNNDFTFTIQNGNHYEDTDTILWFFDSGHVLGFISYAINQEKNKEIANGNKKLNFGSQGFYTVGSSEFEIEFFQKQNVSLFGSMDRYYYNAKIEGDRLHLIRKNHQGKYVHYIYQKIEMPESLKNVKANW
ncbi:MAG: hypothetical protein ACWIPI_10205 [Polaribacter sp.]